MTLWNHSQQENLAKIPAPRPCPGSAGLIDQPQAAEIGVRDSLAWDQALSTGDTAGLKTGN